MTWLLLTLSCIVLWGVTDILFKKSSNYTDPLSHYKTFVWIGIVMALAGVVMWLPVAEIWLKSMIRKDVSANLLWIEEM